MYQITKKDISRGRNLLAASIATPLITTAIPAAITLLLLIFASTGPPSAAVILFLGLLITAIGFLGGAIASLFFIRKRRAWSTDLRERIAADGIRAEEIEWFRKEIKPSEKRALKSIEARDLLLGDAFRDALASRMTATRVLRSSGKELLLAKRRLNSVMRLKSQRSDEFKNEIDADIDKLTNIRDEAKQLLADAEARLQMIEQASSRQGTLADSELALKKLSARTTELPLALDSAKMADEIRQELEKEEPLD